MTIATNGVSAAGLVTTARNQGEFGGDFYVLTDDVSGCHEHPPLATYLPVSTLLPSDTSTAASTIVDHTVAKVNMAPLFFSLCAFLLLLLLQVTTTLHECALVYIITFCLVVASRRKREKARVA
jgi:hypothetical protein